jgi:hypothetical protein
MTNNEIIKECTKSAMTEQECHIMGKSSESNQLLVETRNSSVAEKFRIIRHFPESGGFSIRPIEAVWKGPLKNSSASSKETGPDI